MAEIVISEFMDEAAVERLCVAYNCFYDPNLVDRPEELSTLVADARALIVRNRTQVRPDLLAAASNLVCVGRLGVGLDNIDVVACQERDVDVFPATGANDLSVAEYVITTTQVLLRGAYLSNHQMIRGEWPRQALIGRELSEKTMGLIGFGSIAREVAVRAEALGMTVIAYDPMLEDNNPAWAMAKRVSLDDLASSADVVSLHVPLTDQTHHLAGADFLKNMKSDAVLINAARGGVVDEESLAQVLASGDIAGAALDVFEVEPLTEDAGAKFAGIDNLILTPHIAGVTEESNVRVSHLIADKVLERLESI